MIAPLWAVLGGLIGTTLIVVRGTLFAPLRKRLGMLQCAQCLGWWVGLVGGLALNRFMRPPIDWIETGVLIGGMVSGLAFAADAGLAWLDARAFEAERKG